MDDEAKAAIIIILIACITVCFAAFFKKAQCENGWAASGMNAEWSIVTGCSLETQPVHWIPADSYQERAP